MGFFVFSFFFCTLKNLVLFSDINLDILKIFVDICLFKGRHLKKKYTASRYIRITCSFLEK